MNTKARLNRRAFVATAAATVAAADIIRPGVCGLRAADAAIRETKDFWFRLAPEGPYIDTQRDNKAFGFGDGQIFLSEDIAKSWSHSAAFDDAANITFS